MALKLYGYKSASCTQRVGAILHEKQIPFELHEVNLFGGEHKSPEYLEKQPFGQIPYLVRCLIRLCDGNLSCSFEI